MGWSTEDPRLYDRNHATDLLTWSILLAATLLFPTCDGAGLTRAALEDAEARWKSRPVVSYTIEVSVAEPDRTLRWVRLEVRDGEIVEAVMADNGPERYIESELAHPYTIEGLFQTLGEELAAGRRRYVHASFDPALGFPERIELGPPRDAPEPTPWVLRVESFQPRK